MQQTHPGITPAALRAWRETHGLSQYRLAKLLGVNNATVTRWEAGEMEIGNPVLLSLALEALSARLASHSAPDGEVRQAERPE